MSEINIFLIDTDNKIKEKINLKKLKTYQKLMEEMKKNFKIFPEYYEVFILDKDNKEIEINNEENYKIIEDILFIREIDVNSLEKSLFELNFNRLSESKRELLEEKYNCIFCSNIIKKENPYFCYKCQKLFHEKCLKEWDEKCKLQNKILTCPGCRNELDIKDWNKKLDYENNRKYNADLMNKINKYKINNNMKNNISQLKDKKINELNEKILKQDEIINKYQQNTEKTMDIFKNVLNHMNSIHSLLKLENNNKLNTLLNIYPFNFDNLNINELSNVVNEEFEQFKNYIINHNQINHNENIENNINDKIKIDEIKEQKNKIINIMENKDENLNEIKLNEFKDECKDIIDLKYYVKSKGNYPIFGPSFVVENSKNIELIINGKLNKLVNNAELNEGENTISIKIKNS